ncbi:migration and invasion enhancer 1-like [Armigeres subalbatus]|uniref:migration and invasion enhancer 1-like n=1 Tax=Armigeres subalbatus TaxID=124917 RepID=UPI002ED4353B
MEKRSEKLNEVRVDIEYCNICNSKPQCLELSKLIKERLPEARVACKVGRRGSFEVQINDTLVHSKINSLAFPDYEAVVSNAIAAQEGRSLTKVKEQPITDCVLQ